MKYLLLIILLSPSFTISCQISRVDSIINDYERKYRDDLNESDFLLISTLSSQLNLDCTSFDSLINQNIYSNTFLAELSRTMIHKDICVKEVLDELAYFRPVKEIDSQKNYPIYLGATNKDSSYKRTINYLLKYDYLSACNFLTTKDDSYLKILSYIVSESNIVKTQVFNDCKSANLFILKNYNNEK